MQIELTILAEDILLDNYSNHKVCPITKALARAGYPDLEDVGMIKGTLNGVPIRIGIYNNESYSELLHKLFCMYKHMGSKYSTYFHKVSDPIPVKTFTHIINFQHEVQ